MDFLVPRAFATAALAAILISPTSAHTQQAQEPPTVLVQQVERQQIRPEFQHPAVIEALQTATIRPLVTAQLMASHVTPGALVKKGDLLFELDDREYQFQLAEAEAALQLAQAEEGERKLELDRTTQLVERQTVAVTEGDLARAHYSAAEAKIKSAQAAVDRAQKNLDDTKVYAPFDGRISAAQAAVGDVVAANNPVQPQPLAEMVKLDPIYALAYVSQQVYDLFIQRRDQMAAAGTEVPELEITLIMPGGDDYPATGKFVSWDFQAAANRGSIAARAEFANPDGVLLPGMNVTIRGQSVETLDRIVVPQRAVGQDQQGRYVMVVGDDGAVDRRNLDLGIRNGADWTVISGIDEGESVIVEGLQKVRPGITVKAEPFRQ